jgi:hypothetical protein
MVELEEKRELRCGRTGSLEESSSAVCNSRIEARCDGRTLSLGHIDHRCKIRPGMNPNGIKLSFSN